MKHSCDNCVFLIEKDWNMIISKHYSCENKIRFSGMFKEKCISFEPSIKASNTSLLIEVYQNFTNNFKSNIHEWTIVDDMTKTYKRISGNHNFLFRFKSEEQLDEFYKENLVLIRNSSLKKI